MAGWGVSGFSSYVLWLGWGMKTMLDRNYNATAAVYQKVVILEDKLAEKPVTGKNRKN